MLIKLNHAKRINKMTYKQTLVFEGYTISIIDQSYTTYATPSCIVDKGENLTSELTAGFTAIDTIITNISKKFFFKLNTKGKAAIQSFIDSCDMISELQRNALFERLCNRALELFFSTGSFNEIKLFVPHVISQKSKDESITLPLGSFSYIAK